MKKLFKNKLLLLSLGGVTSAFTFTSCNNTKVSTEEEKQTDNHVLKFEELKATLAEIGSEMFPTFTTMNEEISSNAFENEQDLNHFIDKWNEMNFLQKSKDSVKKYIKVIFGDNYIGKINQIRNNLISIIEDITKDKEQSVVENKVKALVRLSMKYVFGKDDTFQNMKNFFVSVPGSYIELTTVVAALLPGTLEFSTTNIANMRILVEKLAREKISEEDTVNEITNTLLPKLMNLKLVKEEAKKIVDILKNKQIENVNDWLDEEELKKVMKFLSKEGFSNESFWIVDLLTNSGQKVKQLSESEKAKVLEFMRLMKQYVTQNLPLYLSGFEVLKLIISPENN
ncbi:hypothetical protein VO56_02055 [Mycoplasmopsis gallinacea]|uniref:Lipoprotein n=1 Tax=Mycoplasmopsis gallinacea TaxID=29556 RepID=A0A0D5ZJY2_9BACT|nr:hypothetical protein VO56_02055 [Mycoplasmopsis gallinacea]